MQSFAQKRLTSITIKDIEGVWQINTPIVSSGLLEYFQFYRDGKFIYHTSSYDNLNPLLYIIGSFKIQSNLLYIRVDSIGLLTGAKIIGEDPGADFGIFQQFGGKVKITAQANSSFESHIINKCSEKNNDKCIEIDNDKYYKLSPNPNSFKDG